MIREMVHGFAGKLDAAVAADMAECLAAVEGFENHPRVAAMLRERRQRLQRWRGWWLDRLHAAMLREINRLN